jgi:hypothetical protein
MFCKDNKVVQIGRLEDIYRMLDAGYRAGYDYINYIL